MSDVEPFPEMTLGEIAMQCVDDSQDWFPGRAADMGYLTIALAGEVGEFCNLIKKGMRGTFEIDDPQYVGKLAFELTDSFIYLMNIAGQMGIDMNQMYQMKREMNHDRFGNDGTAGETELRVL